GHHFTMMYATNAARTLDVLGELVGRPLGADDVDALNWALAEMGRSCSATQYLETRDWLALYTRRLAGWWAGGFDLLLTPTPSTPPPPLGFFDPAAPHPLTPRAPAPAVAPFPAR